jgi:hypothetical protein
LDSRRRNITREDCIKQKRRRTKRMMIHGTYGRINEKHNKDESGYPEAEEELGVRVGELPHAVDQRVDRRHLQQGICCDDDDDNDDDDDDDDDNNDAVFSPMPGGLCLSITCAG